jgi:pSer/pThr/pTyr-binding forkhead associated (FHA) protein
LKPLTQNGKNSIVEITTNEFKIGRNPNCELKLFDVRISNNHAKIVRQMNDEKEWVVKLYDTSSNGTFINGKEVSSDQILILI